MAYASFVNVDASTQLRGTVVRTGPSAGQCVLALADTIAHSTNLLGVRIDDVLPGKSGRIGSLGDLGSLLLVEAAPSIGDLLYLSATSPGCGNPSAPSLVVPIGICHQVKSVGRSTYASFIPACSCNLAAAHTPILPAASASGLLTLVDGYSNYEVSGAEDLVGISATGRVAGDEVRLTFTSPRWVRNGASVGPGFGSLLLFHQPGLMGYQDIYLADADGRCTFQLRRDGRWQLVAGGLS